MTDIVNKTDITTKKKPMTNAIRIHGKWYNVTNFDHPGGPIMLSLGTRRDATSLFEAHHPFTSRAKLEALLKKYETTEDCLLLDESDTGDEYIWPAYESKDGSQDRAPISDFGHEVVEKVRAHFEGEAKRRGVSLLEATKATPMRKLELFVYLVAFLLTIPPFLRGEWWALFVMPLTNWIIGVNTFHDGSHFALSRNWKINALATYIGFYFSSPLEWYHQHVIGHHAYSNIPKRDPDLYHNGTFERHTKTLRWRPNHAHQWWTWPPIWAIGTYAMCFIKPIQMFVTGSYNRSVAMMELPTSRKVIHWAGRLLTWVILYLLPFYLMPFHKAIFFATVPVILVSFSFMLSSQVNHLTCENIDQYSSDYYKHQVITSHTFGKDSYLTFVFTGGLNLQIEHHLFPCVNHCHLRYIHPIVKAVCQKHNVPYHYSPSLWAAFCKYLKHMVVMARKPNKSTEEVKSN